MAIQYARFNINLTIVATALALAVPAGPAFAAGDLVIDFNAPYNLVVDSNVCSPSTYAPRIATIGASFCNYGDAPLTDVVGHIGDYAALTPAVYPVRTNADVATTSSCLAGRGSFTLTHVGDPVDATRYIGTLAPGQCSWQYWSFVYPRRQDAVQGDDTCGEPVWCASNDPNDDLFLPFDVWGTSLEGVDDDATWRVWMRNEISASANKIFPNGALWFNDPETCEPGQTVTTNGIRYELGVVNKGFDNNGDGVPDYNAWLQPIGDPNWNPACFRLVKTEAQIQVGRPGSLGGGTDTYDFVDNLYFTDIGPNNGVIGFVYYTFACLGGGCNVPLTPYQEAASGFDNEKFAGDYGAQTVTMMVTPPNVTLDKTVADTLPGTPDGIASNGETLEYTIDVENTGASDLGNPALGIPLVIRDSIPAGTSYAAGSAGVSFTGCACTALTLFSTDGGLTWTATEPATAADVTDLQWRLQQAFPSGAGATFSFDVVVDNPYAEPDPVIVNTAAGSFGDSPPFAEASAAILTTGPNSIGDTVWNDDGGTTGTALDGIRNGDEAGIGPVVVTLYWDLGGDGLLDAGDLAARQVTTAGDGSYLFDQVPDGDWIVVVDPDDPASTGIPTGYSNTTPEEVAVTNLGQFFDGTDDPSPEDVDTVDFGYGPSLLVDKTLTSSDPALEGDLVTFDIDVTNTRPSSDAPCTYDVWGQSLRVASSFADPANALGVDGPDGVYATSDAGGGGDEIEVEDWSLGVNPGSITQVEVIFQIDLTQALSNDDLDAELFVAGASEGTNNFTTATLNTFANNPGELAWDVTALRAWDWTDFPAGAPAAFTSIFADFKHVGSTDAGILRIDAIGFRVTSDQICGGDAEDDMSLVPLADTYDPTVLELVSASPPETSVGGGVISWSNVGPLLGGETTTVTVTFRALEPPSDADTLTTNTASVSGARFVDGDPTNDDDGEDTVTVRPTGEIGDRIWNDNVVTGNYVQDPGEVGIPGVTVTLCIDDAGPAGCTVADSVFLTTVTDADGDYLFSGLATAGTYTVEVATATLPGSTFDLTGDPDVGACPVDPTPDSAGCDSVSTATISPGDGNPANNFDLTQDYAYTIPNTIFGNVWEDNDGDAAQESGEDPIAGVTVELYTSTNGTCGDGDDVLLTSTLTDADGDYLFSDLADAGYCVVVDSASAPLGAGWGQTVDPNEAGVCSVCDDQTTTALALSGGAISGAHDFAYQETGTGSIDGVLYADWNGDATRDPIPEEGIAGVTVLLYEDEDGDGVVDPEDALIATTVTGADGSYAFTGLPAGDFTVVVDETDPDLPAAWDQTEDPDEAGVCVTCDGTASVNLPTSSSTVTGVDFGYQPQGFGIIGDTVFQDDDGSGIQDSGELGLANVTVTLYEDQDGDGVLDPEDAFIASTSTDASGQYSFFDLPAGDYLVDVDTADPEIPTDVGGNPYVLSTGNDPDPVGLPDDSSIVLDADFGFAPGGSIGDTVWRDDNGDGQLDNEDGLPNVTVNLYLDDGDGVFEPGGDDALVATTSTDGSGNYTFSGLEAGDYFVEVDTADADLPAGGSLTGDPDEVGTCTTCDGVTAVSLAPAQVVTFADFGFQPAGTIGDAVWIDDEDVTDGTPGDGVYDPFTETGISGVTVNLYVDDGDGVFEPGGDDGAPIDTTTTDADGLYSFGEIANGTYWVEIDTADPDVPTNASQTFDPDEAFPCTTCNSAGLVTLTPAGNNVDTIDFGYGLTPIPEVVIDKDTSTPATFAGGTADYRVVVSNIGDAEAGQVTVDDTLPAGFTLSGTTANTFAGGATGPATCASLTGCGTFTLPAGSSVTIAFTVDVAGSVADGTYDNTASTTFDSDGDTTPDTTVDDDGDVAEDPDTPNGQDPETDEDVTVAPIPEHTVTKSSGAGGSIEEGETFTYTVTVVNTGTAVATELTVDDPIPTGLSAVPGTTSVTFPQNDPAETFADDFESGTDAGSSGSLDWSTSPWVRSTFSTFVTDLGDGSLRVERSGSTARRPADLSPYALGSLSFDYRRVGFDDAADFVVLELTLDVTAGTPTWVEIDRFAGPTNDALYQASPSYDLLNYMASTFAFRFRSSGLANANEYLLVDNLQLEVISRSTTVAAGGDPPNLITPGDGLSLIPDGLQPAEIVTITFDVTADGDLTGFTDITNTVFVSSAELPDPVSAEVTDPVNVPGSWSIDGTVWDDNGDGGGGNRDGVIDAGEPRLENVRVELYDATGTTLLASTLTAADGSYSFDSLTDASYVVRVDESTIPSGYSQSGDPDEAGTCSTCDGESVANDPGGGGTVTKDFGYENEPIFLPVSLGWFRATTGEDGVVFEWTTETETRNVGFALYGLVDGDWVALHDELIPSQAVDSGERLSYAFELADVKSDTFVLADFDTGGKPRFHGPFHLDDPSVGPAPAADPVPWNEIRREHLAKRQARRGGWHKTGPSEVRFTIRESGLYRVTFEDLQAAGLDLAGVPLEQLALFDPAGPVAIHVDGQGTFGRGEAIEFYAEDFDSLYTDANVYTLRVDPSSALRVGLDRTPPSRFGSATTLYAETARVENERDYNFASPNGDPWYDQRISAIGAPSLLTRTLEVEDYEPDGGAASLFVGLWGVTNWGATDPDHHVLIRLNGVELADELFDAAQDHPVEVGVPDGLLLEGANELEIEVPLDLGVAYDIVGLDAYAVTYPRRLIARDGHLRFRGDAADSFAVAGLPQPEAAVYRIADDGAVDRLTRVDVTGVPGSYTVTFAGDDETATYVVATASTYLTPATIEPAPPLEDILSGDAEYLVIAHPDFADGLDDLVARRREQGLVVQVVDVQQVYEHWSGGVVDARAIQDFVAYSALEKDTRFVLLVGGDSYDYKDYLGLGAVSFIPSLYVRSGMVTFAPADALYGDVDGDRLPDLPVGRLPVRTGAELAAIVDKTLAYEDKDYGRTFLSATDAYDADQRISFVDTSAELLDELDPSWQIEHADIDVLGLAGARVKLADTIDQGVAVAQFFGHSSFSVWSFQVLFHSSWVGDLRNSGRPAVVAQWGCWNTYYVSPLANTLGHALMLAGDHGAAAVLGAASLTETPSDIALGREYLPRLTQPGATLGEALVAAKRALVASNPEMTDVIVGWNILGDPALVVEPADD